MNDAIRILAQDPLRHIVLLKHLEAFPENTRTHHASGNNGHATLVLLETAASYYDQRTYPMTNAVALISSDTPELTQTLLEFVPRGVGVVFKLSRDADHRVVASQFAVRRTTSVQSFTAWSGFDHDAQVSITRQPDNAVFDLFEAHHPRAWLEPLLEARRVFACVLRQNEQQLAICFAFENYGRVWEIGGVFTPPEHRGKGHAACVVRTALAELARHDLLPRYQVHEENTPSIRLAESIGLQRFLTITHFLHTPGPA
jgi:RimJ/RimL family protein N-acetyltransferase